jgi:hypothetical protein
MTLTTRRWILRFNAVFLIVASTAALTADIAGTFLGKGPMSRVLHPVTDGWPPEAIGFIEAHGLALILGFTLWRVSPTQAWHLTAAAIHVLLGTANLLFWNGFVLGDTVVVGYVTTAMHGLFVFLQLAAAAGAQE